MEYIFRFKNAAIGSTVAKSRLGRCTFPLKSFPTQIHELVGDNPEQNTKNTSIHHERVFTLLLFLLLYFNGITT